MHNTKGEEKGRKKHDILAWIENKIATVGLSRT